jgi:hypothetical protein
LRALISPRSFQPVTPVHSRTHGLVDSGTTAVETRNFVSGPTLRKNDSSSSRYDCDTANLPTNGQSFGSVYISFVLFAGTDARGCVI